MSNCDEIFIKEMSPIDAYNYGRQMMEKELNAMGDCEYAKGRADAFEECIAYFSEHASEVYKHISARDFICDRLEQLKEQK